MRLSNEVERLISNYQRLLDGCLRNVREDKLDSAIPLVSGL